MDSGIHIGRMHLGMQRFALAAIGFGAEMRERQRGAVMAEYGLLLMVAMLAAFAIVLLFGEAVLGLFQDAYDDFTSSQNGNVSP